METYHLLLSDRNAERMLVAVAALIFAVSAAGTIVWCSSMSAMDGMAMPGGWTMSMAWMRMPGETWFSAATTFVGMWTLMMVAMMLPPVTPMLLRYRRSVAGVGEASTAKLTALFALGYFAVWTVLGFAVFPVGVALASLLMDHADLARAGPFATGLVVLFAGALQFTDWKGRHLACCQAEPGFRFDGPRRAEAAVWSGLKLGAHCVQCCAGVTAILLVIGVMDLRAMAAVTALIAIERLLPAGERAAQVLGGVIVVTGLLLILRAFGA